MKKLILAGLLVFGGINLMAKQCYTVVLASCDTTNRGDVQFIIRGFYHEKDNCGDRFGVGIENAARAYMKAEYAATIEKYCQQQYNFQIGVAFKFDKKSSANREYSDRIAQENNLSYVKKVIRVKGFNVDDWDE